MPATEIIVPLSIGLILIFINFLKRSIFESPNSNIENPIPNMIRRSNY